MAAACLAAACSHTTAYVNPALNVSPAPAAAAYRLILVGDAGAPKQPEPVLDAVRDWASRLPERTTVLYLGDNAYPRGITRQHEAAATRTLRRQIDAVRGTGAQLVFVPGNHDWDRSGREGLAAIRRQEAFVEAEGAAFVPAAGCPGPEVLTLPADVPAVRVVAVDTQWWLHGHARRADCAPDTGASAAAAVTAALATELPVVVVGHHPLATHGPHGGYYDWRALLFPLTEYKRWLWLPLPGLGPLVRQGLSRSNQDLAGAKNRQMVADLNTALQAPRAALTLYAAGHEHSLQVLSGAAADYVLVSGGGSSRHSSRVGLGADTLFAREHSGFMVLDVTAAGLRLTVVDPARSGDSSSTFALPKRRPSPTP